MAVIEAGGFADVENGNLTEVPGYNGWSTHVDSTRPSLVEWDVETVPQAVSIAKEIGLVEGGFWGDWRLTVWDIGEGRTDGALFSGTDFGGDVSLSFS